MSVDVVPFDESRAEEWDGLVERATHWTPFHQSGVLAALADERGAALHMLAGFKGQEPVGLFPLFSLSRGPVRAAFSPPPDLKIPYMGPILITQQQLKRRKRDSRHRAFIEACLEWVDDELSPQYTNVRTTVGYDDVRPFVWNGFSATPRYTYEVDLTLGAEALLAEFSSDARRNVTQEYDVDYEIREGGPDTIDHIVRQIRARHEEQGEEFHLSPAFVTDLYERATIGAVRPYRCDVDGEFTGGRIVVEGSDTVYSWIGGAKVDADLPVNDLLDWRVCTDGMERGFARYDLAGANNPRLCDYKAKFAPDLGTSYRVYRSTRAGNALAGLYDRFGAIVQK